MCPLTADELTDVNGCVAGATNALVCRACPAGSYSSITGGVLMSKPITSILFLHTGAHTTSFCFCILTEVARAGGARATPAHLTRAGGERGGRRGRREMCEGYALTQLL